MFQKTGDVRRQRRQGKRQYPRRLGLRFGTLLGIIVHQNKAVDPQSQVGRQGAQVRALAVPVDTARREILHSQRHFRVSAKGLHDVLFVVLAAQGQQHPLAPAVRHELLQGSARRVEHYAVRAVFPANARPERFVAVERRDLIRRRDDGVDLARDGRGQRHEKHRRVRQMPQLLAVRVVRRVHRIKRLQVRGPDRVDAGQAGERLAQYPLRRFERLPVLGLGRANHHDQRRRERYGGCPDRIRQPPDLLVHSGGQPVLKTHQGGVDPPAIRGKQPRGVQKLLKQRVITGETDLVSEPQFFRPKRQSRLYRFGGEGSGDDDRAIVERHELPL